MKKTLLGCLIAALLIVVVVAIAVWVWLFRELPVLDATLSLPTEVAIESTVTMMVTATNGHDKPITLDSIDIDDSFLSGFQVVSIDPEPAGTIHILGQRSWDFGQSVAPGTSIVVRFELKAVKDGHFSGDVDVCNPNQDFTTLLADVVVKKGVSNNSVEDIGANRAESSR